MKPSNDFSFAEDEELLPFNGSLPPADAICKQFESEALTRKSAKNVTFWLTETSKTACSAAIRIVWTFYCTVCQFVCLVIFETLFSHSDSKIRLSTDDHRELKQRTRLIPLQILCCQCH